MLVALRSPVRYSRAKRSTAGEFAFLQRRFTPRTVFMEVGGSDAGLALEAASYVERVYAVDVSGQFLGGVLMPCNLRLVLCDGVRIPVPEASVNVAWSGEFMDHLRADDVRDHLHNVTRTLAPGGQYLCSTQGSPLELRQRLMAAGFSAVRCYLGAIRLPWAAHSLVPKNLLRIAAIK